VTKSLLAGNQHHMFMHADIDRGKTHSKVRPERLVGVGVVSRGGGRGAKRGITEPLVGSCVARKRRGKGKGKGKKGQAKRERKENRHPLGEDTSRYCTYQSGDDAAHARDRRCSLLRSGRSAHVCLV
jgi:hypothetical protein